MPGLSYAEIRDLVSDQLGTCSVTTEELEANLLGVLEDVKNRLGRSPSKIAKEALPVEAGVYAYAVPSALGRVQSISNNAGHELHPVAYPCGRCADNTETGSPTSWHMDVDEIVLHPIPVADEVFILRGSKARDYVLYDVGTDNLKVWRMVDLPVGLHYAYAEAVLAQTIMKEDAGRAAVFSASALDKIANWKNDQSRSLLDSQRPVVFASGRRSYSWGNHGGRPRDPRPVTL